MANAKPANKTDEVNEFMSKLDHPFKTEVQALRDDIKKTNPGITEQIKWNAPSFSYNGDYLATFNLHNTKQVHLIFHNPLVMDIKSDLLEGDYTDGRRMVYFADMKDAKAKMPELEQIVKELVAKIDKK